MREDVIPIPILPPVAKTRSSSQGSAGEWISPTRATDWIQALEAHSFSSGHAGIGITVSSGRLSFPLKDC
jgi:hypothetical protein